jgi:hypothetical protein
VLNKVKGMLRLYAKLREKRREKSEKREEGAVNNEQWGVGGD